VWLQEKHGRERYGEHWLWTEIQAACSGVAQPTGFDITFGLAIGLCVDACAADDGWLFVCGAVGTGVGRYLYLFLRHHMLSHSRFARLSIQAGCQQGKEKDDRKGTTKHVPAILPRPLKTLSGAEVRFTRRLREFPCRKTIFVPAIGKSVWNLVWLDM
jgi:hypothetical protein